MRRIWMWCLLGLLSLGIVAARAEDTKSSGQTEKAVAALEQQWLQSQKMNNPDLVAPLLADKFMMTGERWESGRQGGDARIYQPDIDAGPPTNSSA